MNQFLTNIPTTITQINEKYVVTYCQDDISGTCIYSTYTSRLQPQPIYLLSYCDMTDIISDINKKSPLTEGDFFNLQFEIREDSLNKLKHYMSLESMSGE
jgi:hypothetical protein